MKLNKRFFSILLALAMLNCGIIANADEPISQEDVIVMSDLVTASTSSFTNTMHPYYTLYVGNGYEDSSHYNYNLSYTHATMAPYFSVTIPANSGSGTITVEFDYVHQGQIHQITKSISFSNSSSAQYKYINRVEGSAFSVSGSSNTDVYARFKATCNNSNLSGVAVYADMDVKYY